MACLSEETLLSFAAGTLEGAALADTVEHLDACAECRRLAALLARGEAPAEASAASAPHTLGRYVLLNVIGAGGMGVVYRAYDPELDRKVALKVLRPDFAAGASSTEGRARLQREAQAMARVSHPNVISVFDVGTFGDDVFVAMELVAGHTLREWLNEKKRTWSECLALFVQAGQGLCAAHAAGLVHRDFKPENVLVSDDGRVRVTDFGLARPQGAAAADTVGTPAYMSPEQLDGAADARSDQFSFCVSLWEALFGERPFAGATRAALSEEVRLGRLRPVPPGSRVPAWLRRVLERGLASSPAQRFPSMDTLLEALARDPAVARRRALLGAGGALIVAALVASFFGLAATQTRRCRGAADKLSGIWDGPRHQEIERAFLATGKPFAPDAFKSVSQALTAWTTSWVGMRTDACLATRVRGEQSEELLDLRMACLDRRLAELSALSALFAHADAAAVEHAAEASAALGDLKECADHERLTATVRPPDAASRAAVEGVRQKLADAKAHRDSGSYVRAVEIATAALAAARPLAYRPVEAEALFALGDAQAKAADYPNADRTLQKAFGEAESTRWDELAAKVALRLAQVAGGNQQHFAEASIWTELAAAKAERLGNRPDLRGAVEYSRAMLLQRQGRWTESLAHVRLALPLLESAHGPESARVAEVERLTGSLLLEHGDLAQARAHHERALAIWTKTEGPAHPDVAMGLNSLGHVLQASGDLEQAETLHRRALEIVRAALGEDHPYAANAMHNIAVVRLARGDAAQAAMLLTQALKIRVKAYGPDHPLVASTLSSMGEAMERQGQPQDALVLHQRALALLEKTLPADHPGLAPPLIGIGTARLHLGAPADAREALERALQLRAEHPGEPARLATARFALARVLEKDDPARARELAKMAREGLMPLGAGARDDLAAIDRWMGQQKD